MARSRHNSNNYEDALPFSEPPDRPPSEYNRPPSEPPLENNRSPSHNMFHQPKSGEGSQAKDLYEAPKKKKGDRYSLPLPTERDYSDFDDRIQRYLDGHYDDEDLRMEFQDDFIEWSLQSWSVIRKGKLNKMIRVLRSRGINVSTTLPPAQALWDCQTEEDLPAWEDDEILAMQEQLLPSKSAYFDLRLRQMKKVNYTPLNQKAFEKSPQINNNRTTQPPKVHYGSSPVRRDTTTQARPQYQETPSPRLPYQETREPRLPDRAPERQNATPPGNQRPPLNENQPEYLNTHNYREELFPRQQRHKDAEPLHVEQREPSQHKTRQYPNVQQQQQTNEYYNMLPQPPPERDYGGLGPKLVQLAKMYKTDDKYAGDSDMFGPKLSIFYDYCMRTDISRNDYGKAFPTMLRGDAQTYYYNSLMHRELVFEDLAMAISTRFEDASFKRANLAKWNLVSLKGYKQKNPEKSLTECFMQMMTDLTHLRHGLTHDLRNDNFMYSKLIQACQDLPECQSTCSAPPGTLTELVNSFKNSVQTYEYVHGSAKTAETYFTDREYHHRPKEKTYNKPTYSKYKQKPKKHCIICKKEGCWSTEHPQHEQDAAKEAWKRRNSSRFNGKFGKPFEKRFQQFIIECEGTPEEYCDQFFTQD